MPSDAKLIRDHFLAAAELSANERNAYLAVHCGQDAELRAAVERLLSAHEQPASLLERPVPGIPEHTQTYHADEQPGAVVAGRYKLLQCIGEGGMGSVWMADQTEPVKRRVAVKLIRVERSNSKMILSRFEAERQAIALMDHPHIAKLFDAGTTHSGQPYFVMELVKGIPLTDYCDKHKLSIRERLALFQQVCSAVQHAHQKGIIHRDLKPGNILVESHDGKPVPKVIDFGLAKATTGLQLTEHTLFTAFGNVLGTPTYMAPEQATFNAVDVDTRADVYSLGVILYELLTGSTPITRETVKKAAIDEMLKLIREQEAPKPSSRLSTSDGVPNIAANRNIDPARLSNLLRGELDWVVLKSLEKDRQRRYETASGFARDIEHYLNDEPVLACPPSARYRLRKFARRNRASLIAGSLIALSLVVGTVVSVWQAMRAMHAEQLAEEKQKLAEENFQKARDAVNEYFTLVSQNKLLHMPGLEPLRRDLLEAALRYYEGMLDRNENNPAVMADIAATHLRVGTIFHYLDRNDDALAAVNKALPIVEQLLHDDAASHAHRRQLAGVFKFGPAPGNTTLPQDPAAARRTLLKALELWTALAQENPAVEGFQSDLASLHWLLGKLEGGVAYPHQTQYSQALEHFQQAAAILHSLCGAHPENSNYLLFAVAVQGDLSWHLQQAGDQASAQIALAGGKELEDALLERFPEDLSLRALIATRMARDGLDLLSQDPIKAEELCRQAQQAFESLVTAFPDIAEYRIELAKSYQGLHEALWHQNSRIQEQIQYARQAVGIFDRLLEDFPERRQSLLQTQAHNYGYLGYRLAKADDYDAARAAFEASSEVFRQCAANTSERERATCLMGRAANSLNIANLWEVQGHGDKAQAARRESLLRYELLLTEGLERHITPGWVNGYHDSLARVLEREGTLEDALRISGELHSPGPELNADGLRGLSSCHVQIASILLGAGQSSEAEAAFRQAVSSLRQAVAQGFQDVEQLENDPRFEPLRSRVDFQSLIAELEAGQE
jgi:serine/threonine protein kinase